MVAPTIDVVGAALVAALSTSQTGYRKLTMPLERADVEHIAALARIGLTEEELETFQGQLSDILDQFELLKQLDTSAVEPTGHAVEVNSVMREDVPNEPLDPEETLQNAPRRIGRRVFQRSGSGKILL